jgi:hypothetical protein
MTRPKSEVPSIRTTAKVRVLLNLTAERERRSAASMIEVLVLDYAEGQGLTVPELVRRGRKGVGK